MRRLWSTAFNMTFIVTVVAPLALRPPLSLPHSALSHVDVVVIDIIVVVVVVGVCCVVSFKHLMCIVVDMTDAVPPAADSGGGGATSRAARQTSHCHGNMLPTFAAVADRQRDSEKGGGGSAGATLSFISIFASCARANCWQLQTKPQRKFAQVAER